MVSLRELLDFIQRKTQRYTFPKDGISCSLVGLGAYAEKVIIPTLFKTQDYALTAVASTHPSRVEEIQKKFGISSGFTEFDKLLASPTDLVFITSKDSFHAQQIIKAARLGKNIFVEKPLCLTEEECQSILRTIQQNQTKLTVGFSRTFASLAQNLKEIVKKRTEPALVTYRFNQEHFVTKGKEWMPQEVGHVLHMFGHFINFCSWLLDAVPLTVTACSLPPTKLFSHRPSDVLALVEMSDKSLVNIVFTTVGSPKQGREWIEVCQDGKTVVLDDFKELRFYGHHTQNASSLFSDKGQFQQLKSFAQFLRGDTSARIVTLQDGLNATRFSLSVLESIQKKKPITLTWK